MSVVTVTATASGVCVLPGGGVSSFGSSSASAAQTSSPSSSLATPGSTASSSAASSTVSSPATSSAAAGSVPTAVINDFSTIIADVGSLGAAVSMYEASGDVALGSVLQANSILLAEVRSAIADASAASDVGEAGASSVISAVEALITGSPGITSLISVLEGASSSFAAAGLAGQVVSDLSSQSLAAGSLASVLSSKAPADQQPVASSLGAEIAGIFSSALAFYGA